MPSRPSAWNRLAASSISTWRNSDVPPVTMTPARAKAWSSRCAACASVVRIPRCQSASDKRLDAILQRRNRDRPRPEFFFEPLGNRRLCDRKAEPDSRQAEEFAEGAQHHDAAQIDIAGKAFGARTDIHEGLVDHEQSAASAQLFGKPQQIGTLHHPPVRVVGIDHDGEVGLEKLLERAHLGHLVPGNRRSARVLLVGRPEHECAPRPHQRGDARQKDLRTRCRHHIGRRRRAIGRGRHCSQVACAAGFGQARQGGGRQLEKRIGVRVDPGRQVDERLGRFRKQRPRPFQAAAVVDRSSPSSIKKRHVRSARLPVASG